MAKLTRVIGTTNQILDVYVLDAASSSGAGLANVTNPNYSWWRSNQSGASTGVASTAGAMGVYSTSAWVQISSTNALGWYQFGPPNGAFVSGDHVNMHLSGVSGMVPVPIEIELSKTDNQSYMSTQVVSSVVNINGPLLDASVSSRVASSDARIAFLDVSVSSRAATADSRFANLDASVSSRVASSDARVANLDTTISSRAPVNVLTSTQAEGYRGLNAPGSMVQLQYEILANIIEFTNNTTTRALNSVTSHVANGLTYLYDSTSPNAITRSA